MSIGLLPATFRGVPFAVTDQSTSIGRRLAVHEFVASDSVWVEDMGRGVTRYRLRGFILEDDLVYGGGAIEAQRALLIAAGKAAGAGLLTHPTLGLLTVSCESLNVGEAIDGATFSSVEWSFLEAGVQSFPSISLDAPVASAALVTAVAIALDAAQVVALNGHGASGSANGAVPTTSSLWAAQVSAAGADATALARLSASLPGNLGRYSRGATSGYLSTLTPTEALSLGDLVALAAAQRAAIAAAAINVGESVASLTVTSTETDYAVAVGELLDALVSACADPADALRLLTQLLAFAPAGSAPTAADGQAVSALWRQLAALKLVGAAGRYQPQSYDDAFATMVRVTAVLDGAISDAGNAGQDALFAALRALRATVVQDLQARGATLAHVRTFSLPAPLPSLALAQRLYRDASRAEELVGEAGASCISPLFMPTRIQALAA